MLPCETLQCPFQHASRPPELVDVLGGEIVHWFELIALFLGAELERQMRTVATALLGIPPVVLVGQKVPEACQNKRSKTPALLACLLQELFFQHTGEKRLRQVTGVVLVRPASPNLGIDRVPIGLTQCRQGCVVCWGGAVASCADDTPSRGSESARTDCHSDFLSSTARRNGPTVVVVMRQCWRSR